MSNPPAPIVHVPGIALALLFAHRLKRGQL